MNKILKYMISAAGVLALFPACGFLDTEPKVICSETFYNNEAEVKYGLAGVYGVMSNEDFYGKVYSIFLSNVDDLCYFNRSSVTANYTVVYRHDASAAEIYSAWTEIYQGIRNANAFMEAVKDSPYDPEHKYYNEARFLRAYYHFLLAQAWGDVPLKTRSTKSYEEVMSEATPQLDVLKWVKSEMNDCIALADESLENAPSRVCRTTVQGILARVCLFMAGESVNTTPAEKKEYYKEAMDYAKAVIDTELHDLNKDYSQIFINYISDKYDTQYRESMWEVDFLGDRSSADDWTNGRIGDEIGLQSSGQAGYDKFKCNYSTARYNASLKLWDLYWREDRTDDEFEMSTVNDVRQEWNMPPYNYNGSETYAPYGTVAPGGDGKGKSEKSIDKTPYSYDNQVTSINPIAAVSKRNVGKYRREVIYEGQKTSKSLYTTINYPILRYSDVLLMYAEAYNEYHGAPVKDVYDYVVKVRNRAGIKTKDFAAYSSQEAFRTLVRNERARELCFESLRKYDLIRWGIFVESMSEYTKMASDERWVKDQIAPQMASVGAAISKKHEILPIPTVELGVNSLLKQNPLW